MLSEQMPSAGTSLSQDVSPGGAGRSQERQVEGPWSSDPLWHLPKTGQFYFTLPVPKRHPARVVGSGHRLCLPEARALPVPFAQTCVLKANRKCVHPHKWEPTDSVRKQKEPRQGPVSQAGVLPG